MEESYWESMKSGVADMVNTGGRPGGAITAALFLKQVSGSDHSLIVLNVFPSYMEFVYDFHWPTIGSEYCLFLGVSLWKWVSKFSGWVGDV